VKILLFGSLVVSGIGSSTTGYPKLGCGHYLAQGTLKQNRSGQFILSLDYRTYSPREFIVAGGSLREKIAKTNGIVQVEVYLPNPTSEKTAPITFLQKFRSVSDFEANNFITQTDNAKCRDQSLFRGSE